VVFPSEQRQARWPLPCRKVELMNSGAWSRNGHDESGGYEEWSRIMCRSLERSKTFCFVAPSMGFSST
jgi:hypothetical protein